MFLTPPKPRVKQEKENQQVAGFFIGFAWYILSLITLNQRDLFIGKAVERVHQLVNLPVGGGYLAL